MPNRENNNSVRVEPIDDPISRIDELPDLWTGEFGHHRPRLGMRLQLPGAAEEPSYPAICRTRSIHRDDAGNFFHTGKSQWRPDNAHADARSWSPY